MNNDVLIFNSVNDLNDLHFTRIKDWKIYFTYKNIRYMIIGVCEFVEGCWQTLYSRGLNYAGTPTSTKRIKQISGDDRVRDTYIRSQIKNKRDNESISLSEIDKEYFVWQLFWNGFANGYMDDRVKTVREQIF